MKARIILITIIFLLVGKVFAQERQIEKANNKFNNMAYIDAISIYEKVAEKGYKSTELFKKLGDSYYFNSEFEKAYKWYNQLVALKNAKIPSEYYYRYAQTLKAVGKYPEANTILQKFNSLSKNDIRANLLSNNTNYLDIIKNNSGRYTIKDAGLNSLFSDYGPAFLGDKIVFASTRDTSGFFKREHSWTNQAFSDLYSSKWISDSTKSKPTKLSKAVNSKFNESTPAFTKDGTTMYFSRNNFKKGKKGKDSKNTTLLKIYKATLKDSLWAEITELSFNSDQYNTAHPALSSDEKTLYFASDRPGSLGQSDIYRVAINEDGSFGTPENLGPNINTEGKESFPFVSNQEELYFSSDGHPGLGGLDVFVTKINQDKTFSNPMNIGEPVNGSTDDFAFIINADGKGFFTSNRAGGKGYDDIYELTETKKLTCQQTISGTLKDEQNQELLSNVEVTLVNNQFEELNKTTTDQNGFYTFTVECGKIYYIRTQKETFETLENKIVVSNNPGQTTIPLVIHKTQKTIALEDDIAKLLDIKIIYFDLDKAFIREDAQIELAKIAEVMLQFPTISIDVRSHTDSRQTQKYNQKLSDARAKSTIAWLIKQGIEATRLSGKGYGETQLVNHCADAIECTEEQHQANRRSEFIVLKL
jgi:outer membrane protein OmpA-like peptidoglycan-associated protein/tetratricopeptide (TPR) repeat protein